MEFVPIKMDDKFKDFDLKVPYDLMNEIMTNACDRVIKKREDQILERLEQNGFTFKDRSEIVQFMKTRCKIISFTYNDRKILKVDDIPICEWWDTYRFENDGNKMTIISGEPNNPFFNFTPNT